MIYVYLIIIYGNKQKIAFSHDHTICWLLNIYGDYLGVHPCWRPVADTRANVSLSFHFTAAPHIKRLCSGQLIAFFA